MIMLFFAKQYRLLKKKKLQQYVVQKFLQNLRNGNNQFITSVSPKGKNEKATKLS